MCLFHMASLKPHLAEDQLLLELVLVVVEVLDEKSQLHLPRQDIDLLLFCLFNSAAAKRRFRPPQHRTLVCNAKAAKKGCRRARVTLAPIYPTTPGPFTLSSLRASSRVLTWKGFGDHFLSSCHGEAASTEQIFVPWRANSEGRR